MLETPRVETLIPFVEGTHFSISGHSYIYLTPFIMAYAYENLDDNHDDDNEKEDDTHEQERKDEKDTYTHNVYTHTRARLLTFIRHTVVSRVLNEQEAL